MKITQALSLCAGTAVAKEHIAHFVDYGVSRSQDLFGVTPSPSCVGNPHEYIQEDSATSQLEKTLASQLWTRSTPCMRKEEREYCVYSNPAFAQRGISILTSPARAIAIANSTAFKDANALGPIEQLNAEESPRWRVEEVPGKGMGLIATQNMELGDHIMSTTASVMIDYNVFHDAQANDLLEMEMAAVRNLPGQHQTKFLNLSTHDGAADFGTKVSKVILTNSFDVQLPGIVPQLDESEEKNWYTVFPEISRMNHDCRPNADYYFDPETFTQHIHAARPISAGEEITISYIDPVQTREERLKGLNLSWHFPCSCSACTQNQHMTSASNTRIQQIQEIRKHLRDWDASSQATPALAELFLSLYQQERLWTMLYEAYTYAAIEHNGVGEPWLATKYARLAVQHGLSSGGPADSDVREMTALARNPWEHWSWMLRTRRRMNWTPHLNESD